MNFRDYAIVSTLLTGAVVFYAYNTRVQFYPAVIYLVTSKPTIMVIGNMAFVFTILLAQLTNKIFLGRLREAEREIIWENLRYAFTETCLALSTFREEMSLNVVIMFTGLLFSKVFHWLCEARVEHLEQAQDTSRLVHFRTVSLMATLLLSDVLMSAVALHYVNTNGPSVQLFFGFEYVLLGIKVVEIFSKYCLSAIDSFFIQGQWYNKSLYELYLKLVIDIAQLFVNVIFFSIIFTYYGVPLHLMRQLYIAVKNVHDRLTHFWRFRRITANLHDRFPNATEEDLEATDRICIICREEMVPSTGVGAPKKLVPCGHIFHFYCLRNWLERQLKCPTCRTDISATRRPVPTPTPPQQQQQQQPQQQAAVVNNDNNINNNNNAPQQQGEIPPRENDNNNNAENNNRQPNIPPRSSNETNQASNNNNNNNPTMRHQQIPRQTQSPPFQFQPPPFGMPQPPLFFPPPPQQQQQQQQQPFLPFPSPFQHGSGEVPSVAKYMQSQIEILQLQLQIYQAQVDAATATRKAARAAMRAREFHAKNLKKTRQREQKENAAKDSLLGVDDDADDDSKTTNKKDTMTMLKSKEEEEKEVVQQQPVPAPAITLPSPRRTQESETLRQRAAAAALARFSSKNDEEDSNNNNDDEDEDEKEK